jgi:hypothetical protein
MFLDSPPPAWRAYHDALTIYEEVPRKELLAAIKDVLDEMGWEWRKVDRWLVIARVPVSWWSWGETFKVRVLSQKVLVRSECALPTQRFDWGKNKENVTRFFDHLDDILDVAPVPAVRAIS